MKARRVTLQTLNPRSTEKDDGRTNAVFQRLSRYSDQMTPSPILYKRSFILSLLWMVWTQNHETTYLYGLEPSFRIGTRFYWASGSHNPRICFAAWINHRLSYCHAFQISNRMQWNYSPFAIDVYRKSCVSGSYYRRIQRREPLTLACGILT